MREGGLGGARNDIWLIKYLAEMPLKSVIEPAEQNPHNNPSIHSASPLTKTPTPRQRGQERFIIEVSEDMRYETDTGADRQATNELLLDALLGLPRKLISFVLRI